jgi:hypothetical protein
VPKKRECGSLISRSLSKKLLANITATNHDLPKKEQLRQSALSLLKEAREFDDGVFLDLQKKPQGDRYLTNQVSKINKFFGGIEEDGLSPAFVRFAPTLNLTLVPEELTLITEDWNKSDKENRSPCRVWLFIWKTSGKAVTFRPKSKRGELVLFPDLQKEKQERLPPLPIYVNNDCLANSSVNGIQYDSLVKNHAIRLLCPTNTRLFSRRYFQLLLDARIAVIWVSKTDCASAEYEVISALACNLFTIVITDSPSRPFSSALGEQIRVLSVAEATNENLASILQEYCSESVAERGSDDAVELMQKLSLKMNARLAGLTSYQQILVHQLLRSTSDEVDQVVENKYRIDIGLQRSFLDRAKSLFTKANHISATSIDSVSTFWTHQKERGLTDVVQSYIDGHSRDQTVRLFVFGSPESVVEHASVLDAHSRHYGENGKVLICSVDSYVGFMRNIMVDTSDVHDILNEDFAILKYTGSQREHAVKAVLGRQELRFEEIDLSNVLNVGYKRFVECMEGFRQDSIPENLVKEVTYENAKIKYGRWQTDLHQNRDGLALFLKKLFDKRKGEIHHMVFFSAASSEIDEERLRQILGDIRKQLDELMPSLKKNYGLKEIWFGRKIRSAHGPMPTASSVEMIDGGFSKTEVESRQINQFVLTMRFENELGLQKYYRDKKHMTIRYSLYDQLDERIKNLRLMKKKFPDDQWPLIDDIMEGYIANKFVIRRDYYDDQEIDEKLNAALHRID